MKQLLILSGKGGTGKTTVASSLIKLSASKAFADCDVDAPNLHLIMAQNSEPEKSNYYGLPKANIDTYKCVSCGVCQKACKFDSILGENGKFVVNTFSCEGCGVCQLVCPNDAISLVPEPSGEKVLYKEKERVFSTAKLRMGSGTSGKLVSEVKKQLREYTPEDAEFSVIDGSPGIGCPVIASMSGADIVLIVAEPSISGINDMERIIKTAETFGTKVVVCINKYDTNTDMTKKIEEYCMENKIEFVGKIPFDKVAVKAVNEGMAVVDYDCKAANAIKLIYEKIRTIILS